MLFIFILFFMLPPSYYFLSVHNSIIAFYNSVVTFIKIIYFDCISYALFVWCTINYGHARSSWLPFLSYTVLTHIKNVSTHSLSNELILIYTKTIVLVEIALNRSMFIVGLWDTKSHSPSRQECYVHHVVSVYIMPRFYYDVDGKYRPVGSQSTTYISVYPGFNLLFLDFSILV